MTRTGRAAAAGRERQGIRFLLALALALLPALGDAESSLKATAPPSVRTADVRIVAPGVWVVPDDDLVLLVPNIGIIEGSHSVLVVDTGLGNANGAATYRLAQRIAKGRHIILTTTHMHPEHALGASAFAELDYLASANQAAEIGEKLQGLGELFKTFGPSARAALDGFKVVSPTRTFVGETRIDLGGRTVVLREMPAHTRGDEIVIVPDAGVVFTGDLVEETSFPVLFDTDAHGATWISVLKALSAMKPRILVPGHGHVGDARLIQPQLIYLEHLQAAVNRAVAKGEGQSTLTARLAPRFAALHPDWEFKDLIPYAIAIFYAEAAHLPPVMPGNAKHGQQE